MNFKKIIVVGLVVALAVTSFGQGRRGFGGMFGGRGGTAFLLRRNDVQTDLALTDDQKAKLQSIQDDMRSQMRDIFQNAGDDRDAARKQMEPLMKKAADDALAVLNADQHKRLDQINIQLNGTSALVDNKDLQDQLGLSDDQRSQISDLSKKQQAANMAIGEKMRNQEIQMDEARAAFDKNQKVLKDSIDKVLTDAQRAKFKDMGGKPFTATDDQGGPGGLLQLLLAGR
jgi:Spy/CpxP family protein refolding chaperone